MASKNPKWRTYERVVAAYAAEFSGIDKTITANARLKGHISGRSRQIVVLIDARWEHGASTRTIIDAKRRKRKMDIKDVESFEGMMKDCRAQRGIIVCTHGFTVGAARRAQKGITIKLLTEEEADEFGWASYDLCFGACSNKNNRLATGLVLWDAQWILKINDLLAILFTGKCDQCHNFHIWCWDCGEKFALDEEGEYVCYCDRNWVSAIEQEPEPVEQEILNAVHLFLVAEDGQVMSLDRRGLR